LTDPGNPLAADLLARIRSGASAYGTFLNMGSAVAVEIAGTVGFDFVVIDLEHGAGSEESLLSLLQASAAGSAAPLVRVEAAARLRIGRALDLGAAGIMVPRVDTADQARDALRWMRYPPEGERGVALMSRAGRYGTLTHADVPEISRRILGIIQIETIGSVEQAAEIAALDGADVLFVGPTDLSHTLGVPGDFEAPVFLQAVDAVAAAANGAGKCAGVLARSVSEAQGYADRGYRFIAVGSDSAFLASMFRGLAADLHGVGVAG
jgi:2-dehydro-3-deoxyglucarate aldolase/4-hydroxy-2-oxoheptanedioate aldolase